VANGGRVQTSPDGITWTSNSGLITGTWYYVSWIKELGLFMASAASFDNPKGKHLATSPDGIVWTTRQSPDNASYVWAPFTYAPSLNRIIAVSEQSTATILHLKTARARTEYDYESRWIPFAFSSGDYQASGVAYSPTLSTFVARTGVNQTQALVSTNNGSTWVIEEPIGTYSFVRGIVWSPALARFLAVGTRSSAIAATPWDAAGLIATRTTGSSGTWTTSAPSVLTEGGWGPVVWAQETSRMVMLHSQSGLLNSEIPVTGTARSACSTDSLATWTTTVRANTYEAWSSLAWAPQLGRFVALGVQTSFDDPTASAPNTMYSGDGVTWVTAREPALTWATWTNLSWTGQRFVANGSSSGRIVRSETGLPGSWVTQAPITQTIAALHWSADLGRFQAHPSNASTAYLESPDGIAWTSFTDSAFTSVLRGASVWVPTLKRTLVFGTVSSNPFLVQRYNERLVNTTPSRGLRVVDVANQVAWTSRSKASTVSLRAGVFIPEVSRILMFRFASGTEVNRSDDFGSTWTSSSLPAAGTWSAAVWIPERQRVIVLDEAAATSLYAYSDNYGTSWITQSLVSSCTWQSIAWNSSAQRLVAVGRAGGGSVRVQVSDDFGTTWHTRSVVSATAWRSVVWVPETNRLVAVSSTGSTTARVMTSDDNGDTWTIRSASEGNSWYSVCWIPQRSRLVAVSIDGTNKCMVSDNYGVSWTAKSMANNIAFVSVVWGAEANRLVAVAESTDIVNVSDDYGDTWVAQTGPNVANWNAVYWIPPALRFIAVANQTASNNINVCDFPSTAAASSALIKVNRKPVLKTSPAGITIYGTVASFTGAHENRLLHRAGPALNGRVVSSSGVVTDVTLSEALPDVRLSTSANDESVYGVLVIPNENTKPIVNGIGEGAVWVCDAAGPVENGDYLSTASAAGYTMRQEEDWQCAHTVAKIVVDCDFEPAEEIVPEAPAPDASSAEAPAPDAATAEAQAPDAGSAEEPAPDATTAEPIEEIQPVSEEPIEEITTPGAAETQEAAVNPVIPTYWDTQGHELRYLVQRDEPDAETGDNTMVVSRDAYEQAKAEGKQVWRAVFVGCTYHCS